MKYEAFKDFKHCKPHYPKKVRKINPVTGLEEMILQIKKPRVIKNIPLRKMEQDFHKGFLSKDIECLFMNKIGFKAEDKEQAMQFQKVVTICFQKGINSENAWSTKWREIKK
ncbi:hypothetical protein Hanom_Chr03g00202411 [Helianthus anomalus]